MKTVPIIFILSFPLLAFSQTPTNTPNYPILSKGEEWIAQHHADSALIYAQRILSKRGLNPSNQRQALLLIGRASFELGRPEEAIIPLQKSIVSAQKNHDDLLLLRSQMAIVTALRSMEGSSLDSVALYLAGAKKMAENLHDTISLAKIYINTSNVLYYLGEHEEAVANNYFCEALLKNTNYDNEKALNLHGKGNNLMEIYLKDEKEETLINAQQSYLGAIDLFQKLGNKINEAHSRNSLAGSFLYSENLGKASQEVNQSIKLGIDQNNERILLNGYYTLSSLYEMDHNTVGAVDALEKLNAILKKSGGESDIIFIKEQFSNSDTRISSALINSKINIFKKQIENEKIAQEKLVAIVFSLFLLLIIVIGFIYFRQRSRLEAQKQKILQEEIENLLKGQEIEYMRARFEGEEEGRHRIARQIHDGVGGLLVSAKWNLESALEEISKKETKVAARLNENLRLQENSYKELRRVVHELAREDSPWWEDLEKFYQQLAYRTSTKIQFYAYNLDRRVRGTIGEEARLIVQEVITNALKHAKATEINVQINQIDDVLGIIIEDNGIGFDQRRVIKGIGLQSIEERCSKLGGEISIETGKGAGTTVFVDIPINKHNILKENPLLYAGSN